MVVTAGDSFADLVAAEGLGVVVPADDVPALVAGIETVVFDEEFRTVASANIARVRERFIWANTLDPLLTFVRDPKPAADRAEEMIAAGGRRVVASACASTQGHCAATSHWLCTTCATGTRVVARKVIARTQVTMTAARRGFVLIVAATIGCRAPSATLITLLVYRFVGPGEYATFAVFWSTMFLLMGALGGIQQEITRSTHRSRGSAPGPRRANARLFAIVVASCGGVLILATSPLWVGAVYPDAGWALVPPLASRWVLGVRGRRRRVAIRPVELAPALACMVAVDPLLRIILLSVTLIFTRDVVILAWMVALPVPLALLVLLWPFLAHEARRAHSARCRHAPARVEQRARGGCRGSHRRARERFSPDARAHVAG